MKAELMKNVCLGLSAEAEMRVRFSNKPGRSYGIASISLIEGTIYIETNESDVRVVPSTEREV